MAPASSGVENVPASSGAEMVQASSGMEKVPASSVTEEALAPSGKEEVPASSRIDKVPASSGTEMVQASSGAEKDVIVLRFHNQIFAPLVNETATWATVCVRRAASQPSAACHVGKGWMETWRRFWAGGAGGSGEKPRPRQPHFFLLSGSSRAKRPSEQTVGGNVVHPSCGWARGEHSVTTREYSSHPHQSLRFFFFVFINCRRRLFGDKVLCRI